MCVIVLVSAECVDAVKKSSRNMSCMCAFICVTVVCEFVRVVTGHSGGEAWSKNCERMNQTSAQRSSVVIGGHQDPIRVIGGHRSSPEAFKRVATVAATVAAAVAATVGAAVAATVGVMGAAEAEAMAEARVEERAEAMVHCDGGSGP